MIFFLVDCEWSDWGEWSKCSVSCGDYLKQGTNKRFRHIHTEAKFNGEECNGENMESRNCPHADCEYHCEKKRNDVYHPKSKDNNKCICTEEDGPKFSSDKWMKRCPGNITLYVYYYNIIILLYILKLILRVGTSTNIGL